LEYHSKFGDLLVSFFQFCNNGITIPQHQGGLGAAMPPSRMVFDLFIEIGFKFL